MTKYKPDFKAKIVHEYLTTPQSSRAMGRKYSISSRLIRKRIQRYRLSGIGALKQRRHPRTLTADCIPHVYGGDPNEEAIKEMDEMYSPCIWG